MTRTIEEYQAWVKKGWFFGPVSGDGGLTERDLHIMTMGLSEETGEVMGKLKKRIRDDHFDIEAFKKEMGDVLFYWCQLCTYFGIPIQDVMQANIDKCESRKARGTRRGSGDDR